MVDNQTNNEQLKIELLSQWKLEAESRNSDLQIRLVGIVHIYLALIQDVNI